MFRNRSIYNQGMVKTTKTSNKDNIHRHYVAMLLVAAFAGLLVIAATGKMNAWEVAVFDSIYFMPDSWRWFALLATQFGNVWIVIGVVGLLFAVRKNPQLALVVFRNSLLTYGVVEIMKLVANRPRPMFLLDGVVSRELAVYGNGFPSGHTALATVLSLTLLPYLPKYLRWVPFIWIGLVGWSRIYLGVHAPLDIIGGFIIGALVVLLADLLPWPKHQKR